MACERSAASRKALLASRYDMLAEMQPTPVVLINRAVAVAQLQGPEAGLAALALAAGDKQLERYPFLAMASGEFHRRSGDMVKAMDQFTRALALARTEPEAGFIRRKLAAINGDPR